MFRVLLALVFGASSTAVVGDSKKPVIAGDRGRKLEAALFESGGEDFWGSVLVVQRGDLIFAKAYGMADYDDTPNNPLTLFELASTSKQFTATAVLRLHEKKKLKVDDPLPEFFEDVPEDKSSITLHQLLSHTSGMSGAIGVPYASPIARDQYIAEMLAKPLANSPGTTFEYCNAGYALLAAVVEIVSKMDFEDYCAKHLFRPAKLNRTGFVQDRALRKDRNCSVRRTDDGGRWTAVDWHYGWGYRGMGGVVSHVYDLWRWDQALRGEKILRKATRELLFEPVLERYACGWRVGPGPGGRTLAEHAGSVAGYGINFARFLDEETLVVVLSNDPQKIHEITRVLLSQL